MTTYTVIDRDGTVIDRNLTALKAMAAILEHDGYAWKFMRAANGYLSLWHSDGSANSTRGARHFVKTVAGSPLAGLAGRRAVARQVISAAWPRLPEAMTDADYDDLQAQFAADNADEAEAV